MKTETGPDMARKIPELTQESIEQLLKGNFARVAEINAELEYIRRYRRPVTEEVEA